MSWHCYIDIFFNLEDYQHLNVLIRGGGGEGQGRGRGGRGEGEGRERGHENISMPCTNTWMLTIVNGTWWFYRFWTHIHTASPVWACQETEVYCQQRHTPSLCPSGQHSDHRRWPGPSLVHPVSQRQKLHENDMLTVKVTCWHWHDESDMLTVKVTCWQWLIDSDMLSESDMLTVKVMC